MPASDHPDSDLRTGPVSPSAPHESEPNSQPSSSAPADVQNTSQVENPQPESSVADTQNPKPTLDGGNTATTASTNADGTDPSAVGPQIESGHQKVVVPAVEKISESPDVKEMEDTGPSLVITLLLTTGARHPFKIDGKYLRKRSVNVDNHDPFAMSVYTLKELIWREWRSGKIHFEFDEGRRPLTFACRLGKSPGIAQLDPTNLLWKVAGGQITFIRYGYSVVLRNIALTGLRFEVQP